ncbi:IclR family transcriptional regulator [Chelatococcus composti]|jgi:DNA-binding IclR family transcriptional regulator|uniref:DNA-binding IclR family transcriptional regulator n=1 Tax=Chelatococcus composti TaxID=1743235 RepID=A0A841KKB3_9HYPH|nr:IclR family transcriptional regulator [Chelatococcus composti]MBB6169813.1 DNA-binding IclR family transcriptional regulator [Chelatococcus composti]MBS7737224.1 IclR family transcriptional regulator [Chelatococcus composti]GGG50234.1 transcriptional regulator [Chelatococcus composti]
MSSIDNGLRILALLGDDRPCLRVGEVARDLDMPKASVSRLMKTLSEAGLLERDDRDGSYFVGERALDLGRLYLARHTLLELVGHALDDLVKEFGFTGHAGIVSGGDRILLMAKQGSFPLQHTGSVAERKPAYDSIIGRAILARLPDEQVLKQLGYRDENDTVSGISGRDVLAEMARIRKEKIAYSSSLVTPGISSVGGAVADPGRNETIALCLSYPTAAADEALSLRMRDAIRHKLMEIGRRVRDPFWLP